MNSKRLFDAAMIFLIGASPLGFEYLKQNVQKTTLIEKIQKQVDSTDNQNVNSSRMSVRQFLNSQSELNVQSQANKRLILLKQWKSTSIDTNITEIFAISSIHTLGGLLYPSAFYLSILSYFILYQVNFINEYMILNNKNPMFEKSSFSFQKINRLYLYLGVAGLGLAGVSKGLTRMNQSINNGGFK